MRIPLVVLSGLALGLLGLRGAAPGESGSPGAADLVRAWGGGILASSLACFGAAWLLYLRKDGLTLLRGKPRAPGASEGPKPAGGQNAGSADAPPPEKAERAAKAAQSIGDFALSGLCLFLLSVLAQFLLPSLLR